jgi:hypothetical protein
LVAVIVAIALGAKRGNTVKRALLVDRVRVFAAVLAGDARLREVAFDYIQGRSLDLQLRTRAKFRLGIAVVMLVAVSLRLRDAVRRALLVDRVKVLSAELTRDASMRCVHPLEGRILVDGIGGTELAITITPVVAITRRTVLGDAVLGTLLVNGVLRMLAVGTADALVLAAQDGGAELGLGVAVVVAIAVGIERRDAVLWTPVIERILVLAILAASALALLVAELGFGVAVVMQGAMRSDGGLAMLGAVVVDRHFVVLAELASSACLRLLVAKFARGVAVRMRITCAAQTWVTMQRTLITQCVLVLAAKLATEALVLVGRVEVAAAKLVIGVTLMVRVAFDTIILFCDAVRRAFVIDGVLALVAPLAAEAFVVVILAHRAELGIGVAVVVAVAVGVVGRNAMFGAKSINSVRVLRAIVACDAFVLPALELRAELTRVVTVRVLVAAVADRRSTVCGALFADGNVWVAEVAAEAVVRVCPRGTELCFCVAMLVPVALYSRLGLLGPSFLVTLCWFLDPGVPRKVAVRCGEEAHANREHESGTHILVGTGN